MKRGYDNHFVRPNKWDRKPHAHRSTIQGDYAAARERVTASQFARISRDYPGWWRIDDDRDDVLSGDRRVRIEWSDRDKWLQQDREIWPSPPPSPHTPEYSDEDEDVVYPSAYVSPASEELNAPTAFNTDEFLKDLGEQQKRRRQENNDE